MPSGRQKANKSPEATLQVHFDLEESRDLHIVYSDDGRGLSLEDIRKKAVERGLVDTWASQKMPAKDAANLIFEPGFSTREVVSEISGRGVGLDAVRSFMTELDAEVWIETHDGISGDGFTPFSVHLRIPAKWVVLPKFSQEAEGPTPLTLSMMDCM